MSAPRVQLGLALIALLLLPTAPARAAGSDGRPATRTLRAATLEPVPVHMDGGRFRLRARLQPAPARAISGELSLLKLDAVFAAKASAAACPLAGALFSDGFESP